jgi:hypothetical protein
MFKMIISSFFYQKEFNVRAKHDLIILKINKIEIVPVLKIKPSSTARQQRNNLN